MNVDCSGFRRLLLAVSSIGVMWFGAAHAAEPPSWPVYGPDRGHFRVDSALERGDGLTNTIPDIVGPVDGSAKLTIFTEGNHYPVLLPLVLEAFPQYCAETGRCDIASEEIMVVTLPQVMIVAGLEAGGFRFGNAQLPVGQDTPVFPDLVMLGEGPMARLHEMELLQDRPHIFARHRGMGLLLEREAADAVADLEAFAASDLSFVMATPYEAGARNQYLRTLNALLGEEETETLLMREVPDFPGRLAIQHRDIPYAVMNGIAPTGLVFGHLARFYADYWPDRLVFVEIAEAAPFGTEIAVAKTRREGSDPALTEAFVEFLLEAAPETYAAGGFTPADGFAFGREIAF